MIFSIFLMIPCEVLLKTHLKNTMIVDLLDSFRGAVDGLGDKL